MDTQLQTQLETTMGQLTAILDRFDAHTFNTIPYEGSWTAGQVADHVYKSVANIGRVLNGNTKPADRDPWGIKPMLEQVFLNFDHKLKSPDFILPGPGPFSKDSFIALFNIVTNDITGSIRSGDLTQLCLDFEFPTVGCLTRQELIYFAAVHTQRHIHQLQKILNTFIAKTETV